MNQDLISGTINKRTPTGLKKFVGVCLLKSILTTSTFKLSHFVHFVVVPACAVVKLKDKFLRVRFFKNNKEFL